MTDPEQFFGPVLPDRRDRARRIGAALAALASALLVPDRGVPRLVAAARFRLAMALTTGAAVLACAAAAVRLDVAPTVLAENAGTPPPPPGPAAGKGSRASAGAGKPVEVKTDSEIEEEIEKRTALIQVKTTLAAALGTPARIVLLGLGLLLLGRYLGGRPSFDQALTAAAVGALPWAIRSLIAAAATLRQDAVFPSDLDSMVAGSLPVSASSPLLARLVAGADLFSLWSVVLCSFGLAAAAGIGRIRSTIAVAIGFLLVLLLNSSVGAR